MFARTTNYVGAALLALIPASALLAQADAPALPRYRLQVGQQLTWRTSLQAQYTRQTRTESGTWRVWVTRQNEDGSWHLILCQQNSSKMQLDGKDNDGGDSSYWCWCDLYADGRIAPNPSLRYGPQPWLLFPRLPADAKELANGWSVHGEDGDTSYRAAVGDGGALSLTAKTEGPEDKIYLSSSDYMLRFDAARGLLQKGERKFSQGYGFVGKGTATVVLDKVENGDGKAAAALAADFDRAFASKTAYDEKVKAASEGEPQRVDELLATARLELQAAQQLVNQDAAKKLLDEVLQGHEQLCQYTKDSAERRQRVIDKPSPEWEAKDLAGGAHSLQGHRGKVLVLDFWYRGCGWCMKAMPQVIAVSEHFAGKPVAVLAMNTDRNVDDAKFVVDALGIKYPTLLARGIPEKFGVRGYPTLVIIDQEGVVRGFHVGYSPRLQQDVTAAVEKLLQQ